MKDKIIQARNTNEVFVDSGNEINPSVVEEDQCIEMPDEPCESTRIQGRLTANADAESVKTLSQWSSVDGSIIPVSNTFGRLERGYYSIHFSNQLGMYFTKDKVELNKLYRLPNTATDLILNDISKFWQLEDTYKKYHRVFRRNYLLYSAPGTGKTSLINLMCEELIDVYDGLVFSLSTEEEIEAFPNAVKRIRKIEPDRKIIAIIEDIDSFTQGSNRLNTLLLNILDGNLKLSGLVTIATTNHIEYLEERYTNRPSRFDRVVEFPLPNAESRRIFIEKTVLPEDIEKINIDEWVEKTEGFTIDHINELILLFFVFGHSEKEAFDALFEMTKTRGMLKNKSSVNKKEIGFN